MWQCDPYFDQIGCSHPGCEPAYQTPKCVRKCVKGNQIWKRSKHYSVKAYRVKSDPQDIMAEVYKNGPVEVAFTVFEVNESFCPSAIKFSAVKFCKSIPPPYSHILKTVRVNIGASVQGLSLIIRCFSFCSTINLFMIKI